MKKYITILPLLLFLILPAKSQIKDLLKKSEKEVISNYLTKPEGALQLGEFKILLHLNYGGTEIKNPIALKHLYSGKIKQINLYYSAYPKGGNFDILNQERISNLLKNLGDLVDDSTKWKLVRQTDCSNEMEAQQLFHGFEILLEFSKDINLTSIQIDSTFKDFVVEKVFNRHDWNEMLIVTDMTGSMGPYIAQLFLWLKLNTIDDRIKQFVFFNDGDTRLNENKVIGQTGGIYQTKSKVYKEVEKTAIQSMLSGSGGDLEENDIEAVLRGMKLCPNCKENIMIVDNNSPVRDLELIKNIKQPVRIIICGSSGKINSEYLNLARKTKGSIHLMEQDLYDLIKFNEGETLELNGVNYKIEKNKFVEMKKI